ncbi:hypothetical protein D9758_010951 [Tetrapyrgos nigripes]|uniref:Uncharacterized protein n=1 Tax=Tetrapyrgos nigripes TaxID=182062 RepID=A0A8H5CWG3_9AGAR|nr:hypothetical protein D9758_010951 [Tetrapyrgos nigripes]
MGGVEGGFGNRDGFGDVDGEGGVSEGRDAREFNILELGAGTGLVSITAGKVAEVLLGVSTSTGMDTSVDSSDGCVVGVDENGHTVNIVATDYFPAVLDNLKENLERNFPSPSSSPSAPSSSISESSSPSSRPRLKSRVQVMAHPLDWSTFSTDSCTASCTTNTNTISFSSPPSVASTPSLHESSSSSPWSGGEDVEETEPNPNPKSKPERVLKVGYGLTPAPAPAFHLIIPLRKTFALESESVELVFRWALGSRDGDGKGVGRNCNCGEGAGAGAGLDVGVSDTKGDDTHNTQNRKDLESGLDPGKNLELVIYSKQIILVLASGSSRGTGTGTGGEAGEAEAEEDGPESVEYAYYVIGWGVASSGPFLDMSSITSPAQSEG